MKKEYLVKKYGINQVDLIILFGGTVPHGADVVSKAMNKGLAKKLMIVGGQGHTTESLRFEMNKRYPGIKTKGKMEADILAGYLESEYNIKTDLSERESTNCGNNITYALDVIQKEKVKAETVIIVQDATMQLRMDAGFKKYLSKDNDMKIINYASYHAEVIAKNGKLVYSENDIWGMWSIERYIELLMGEIYRLTDNAQGYGPKGKNFITHVEIPKEVKKAFDYLNKEYSHLR